MIMESWKKIVKWMDARREHYIEILRIYLGCALFAKGVSFILQPDLTMQFLAKGGQLLAGETLIAHYVVAAHLIGGLFMAMGLFTRVAALLQIPVLFGAVFLVHRAEGLFTADQNLQFSILVLFLLILIFLYGPGFLSLDKIFFGKTD